MIMFIHVCSSAKSTIQGLVIVVESIVYLWFIGSNRSLRMIHSLCAQYKVCLTCKARDLHVTTRHGSGIACAENFICFPKCHERRKISYVSYQLTQQLNRSHWEVHRPKDNQIQNLEPEIIII